MVAQQHGPNIYLAALTLWLEIESKGDAFVVGKDESGKATYRERALDYFRKSGAELPTVKRLAALGLSDEHFAGLRPDTVRFLNECGRGENDSKVTPEQAALVDELLRHSEFAIAIDLAFLYADNFADFIEHADDYLVSCL